MHDVSGITGAAPIWAAVLRLAQDAAMATPPRPPAGVQATLVHWPDGAEPPRREWFLTGTEMAQVRRVPAAVRPRILAPASGSILALDPDIPHNLQQVVLASNLAEEESGQVGAAGHLLRWELDGKPLGTGPWMAWQPRPGRHVVRLLGPHGAALDQARFVVKGE
jgi:penicillin-binding protein 1C